MLKFRFFEHVDMAGTEDTLLLAVLAAESIHGRAGICLDACFQLKGRVCAIEDDKAVGRTIAQVFTGFLAREFGEDAFSVVRLAAGNRISEAA
ncbi:conserved hypothetical protein [Desulfarculus baarsii DSM 2075]|uniref:Uncharacterized protein n=1 Tax=Desulfarculus baarsii (strain ATCC 33931 / DSM 2075 / LMG 7858 / VKM B-1802 / 2st14) TaxID=644282 RepID=E1QK62_DESB2|nr:hypothetical protein [Desulfarculus baarsii]ADK85955.1 conserved hypothetical protein [Desulfarculus baarsii DSM 2075]